MTQAFDSSKLTDMEIAFKLLRLMDDYDDPHESNKSQRTSNVMSTCIRIIESAVETFTNPFAKNLVMAKLAEQGH